MPLVTLFGANYNLDLSFAIGDAIMAILAVLAFNLQRQIRKVEKGRIRRKVCMLLRNVMLSVERLKPISVEPAEQLMSEAAGIEEYFSNRINNVMGVFGGACSSYMLLLVERGQKPADDGVITGLARDQEMVKESGEWILRALGSHEKDLAEYRALANEVIPFTNDNRPD